MLPFHTVFDQVPVHTLRPDHLVLATLQEVVEVMALLSGILLMVICTHRVPGEVAAEANPLVVEDEVVEGYSCR